MWNCKLIQCRIIRHTRVYAAPLDTLKNIMLLSPWWHRVNMFLLRCGRRGPSISVVKWYRRGWGGKWGTRRWQALHLFSNLSAVKSARAAKKKMEIADFLIIGVWECDWRTVVLPWLSVSPVSWIAFVQLPAYFNNICVRVHAKSSRG